MNPSPAHPRAVPDALLSSPAALLSACVVATQGLFLIPLLVDSALLYATDGDGRLPPAPSAGGQGAAGVAGARMEIIKTVGKSES